MTQIKLRRGTSANFTSKNPVLGIGEPAYETDTKKLKIGDGTTTYTQLPYFSSGGGGSSDITAALPIKIVDGVISLEVDGQTIQIVDGKLHANLDELGNEVNDLSGRVTSAEADILTKQDKLTAGDNITISAENVISATGGSAPANMVTTDTEQSIKARKNFYRTITLDQRQTEAGIECTYFNEAGNICTASIIQPSSLSLGAKYGSLNVGLSKIPLTLFGSTIKDKDSKKFLTQGNVTAGDNITITNTTNGISIAAAGGGLEVKTASTADFNSSELLETGLYYISPALNPQNGPSPYAVSAMLVTMKWYADGTNQRIQQTWIGCEDLVANQIYTRYSKANGVMNSWVRVDSNKIASVSALGSIKVGDGLSIASDGTLSPSSKVVQLVESYVNGTSGYHLYSNGYCEQWGRIPAGEDSDYIITLLRPYKNTDYQIGFTSLGNNSVGSPVSWLAIRLDPIDASTVGCMRINFERGWFASGYTA